MNTKIAKQCCLICAWRETCSKRFCIPDGGAHCPDFSRDVTIKNEHPDRNADKPRNQEKQ